MFFENFTRYFHVANYFRLLIVIVCVITVVNIIRPRTVNVNEMKLYFLDILCTAFPTHRN